MRKLLIPIALATLMLAISACNSSVLGPGLLKQTTSSGKTPVTVVKTANASFTPAWKITKAAYDINGSPVTSATIDPGAPVTFHYIVTESLTGASGGYTVSGTITVANSTTGPVTITDLTDTPQGGTAFNVTCPSTSLADGGSVTCSYTYTYPPGSPPPLGTTLTNEAQATVSYPDSNGNTVSGQQVEGYAQYSFNAGSATPPAIQDTLTCPTGFTCTKQGETKTTSAGGTTVTDSYDLVVANTGNLCGSTTYDLTNIASLTGVAGATASYTITLSTSACKTPPPPPPGNDCTLTQGYWKTHSSYGPATPEDPTWDTVGGPDAPFYISGMSWIQLFDTAPKGGNAYIQLAHQFMAAQLNINAGASEPTDVQGAMSWAKTFFEQNKPYSYTDGATAKQYASLLDNYNNGKDGVPSCEQQPPTCKTSSGWLSAQGYNKGGSTGDTSCNTSCPSTSGWLSAQGYNKGGTSTNTCTTGGNDNKTNSWSQSYFSKGW